MSRARNPENRGLPARWRHRSGAYYYQVPPGLESMWDGKKEFRLGKSLPEAYKAWGERMGGETGKVHTVAALLTRYAQEVVPTKAKTTQAHNQVAMKRLHAVLGAAPLKAITPTLIYEYVRKRGGTTSSHREVEVLSHALTKAVEWGIIDKHPFAWQMRLKEAAPRTRYVEDWEIVECLSLESKRKRGSVLAVQAYIRVKLLTGLRRGDLLRLCMADLREDGIHVTPNKTAKSTGKRIVIAWSDELREAVAIAKAARPVQIAPWLFCNRDGACYINEETGRAGGWDTMWRNFMSRVLAETKTEQKFNEHDLRAKCASDAETLEHARALMAHADSRLTDRVYRRKPEMVKPLR